MLIAPGAIALLVTRSFGMMLCTAVGVAVASAIGGIWGSMYLDSAPGPTIVVLMSLIFVVVLMWSVRRTRLIEARRAGVLPNQS